MKLLALPLWDQFKQIWDWMEKDGAYPLEFSNEWYGLMVFLSLVGIALVALIVYGIYSWIYSIRDRRKATTETLTGIIIDRIYQGASQSTGTGTAVMPNGTGGLSVGIVSTSSNSPETFTLVVKTKEDEIYQIPVDIQQYYLTNTEKPVRFEVTTGGLSGELLNIELI